MRWSSRRVVLTLVFAVGCTLLVALALRDWTQPGRAPKVAVATFTPVGHRTYTFVLRTPPSDVPWHPGERLVFTWTPHFDNFTMSQRPSAVQCTVAFYGPFPTYADAQKQAAGPLALDATPSAHPLVPAVAPPPLQLDDWMSQPQTTVVTLPATLAPGYYIVQDREVYAGGESGNFLIVSVAATPT